MSGEEFLQGPAVSQADGDRSRRLFETMAQGVVYQNVEGRILSANPAAEEILGLSLDQMQGRSSMDPRWKAIHEDGSPFPGETHPAMVALRTGARVQGVIMGVFNPGDEDYRWVSIDAIPQFEPGQESPFQVYTVFSDITDRKRMERLLGEVTLREREKLRRDLHDGIAQRLAGTSYLANALQKTLSGGSPEAQESARRIADLVRSTMELTRQVARGLKPLGAEPFALTEALRDLVMRTDDLVIVEVSDNGVGLPEEPKRTGMGMDIMRSRAALIGAGLSVHSGKPGGTVVTCSWPSEPRDTHDR